jgi:hypothetical protein
MMATMAVEKQSNCEKTEVECGNNNYLPRREGTLMPATRRGNLMRYKRWSV